jgi:probable rRNA maturation factor
MTEEGSRGRPSAVAKGFGETRRSSRSERRRSGRPAALTIEVLLPAGLRAPGLARWLQTVAPARARGTVTVAVVPDARVRALNRQYRKKDQNTDVLSFPAEGPVEAGRYDRGVGPGLSRAYLGDVVIAAGVARRQAREAGHSLPTELRILALHGLLHLLGYDHEHDDGQMARLERRLRRKGGLREGLIERAG